jgi:hypothetical protein
LNISGEITVAALQEAVFKALSDPPFFASCIEGVGAQQSKAASRRMWTTSAQRCVPAPIAAPAGRNLKRSSITGGDFARFSTLRWQNPIAA